MSLIHCHVRFRWPYVFSSSWSRVFTNHIGLVRVHDTKPGAIGARNNYFPSLQRYDIGDAFHITCTRQQEFSSFPRKLPFRNKVWLAFPVFAHLNKAPHDSSESSNSKRIFFPSAVLDPVLSSGWAFAVSLDGPIDSIHPSTTQPSIYLPIYPLIPSSPVIPELL